MTRTIHLHIGAHKTGTTTVQHFFHSNRARLAALGYLYPNACRYQYAQHRLAFALKEMKDWAKLDVPDFQAEAEDLRAEIDSADLPNVIVSSEEFFALSAARIGQLAAAFAGFEVKILAVLRRPDELFASIYNQKVKDPKNGFKVDYARFLADPRSLSTDLRFEEMLANWAHVFGPDAITAMCYEAHPDAVKLVCRALDLRPARQFRRSDARINESVSVRTAELVRFGKQAGLDEGTLRKLFCLGQQVLTPNGKAESLLAPEERLDILKKMDPTTDAVFAAYVKHPNIYRSDRFALGAFPEKTTLNLIDAVRLLGALLEAEAS